MNKNKAMKICMDCKWYNKIVGIHCTWHEIEMHPNEEACGDFEPPTNGDKIRQMSDEEFVATIEELSLRFSGRSEFIAWLKQEAKDE